MMKRSFLGIAAALAFASVAHAADRQSITICTGGEGKPYNVAATMIAEAAKASRLIDVKVVTSNGTGDNIDRTILNDAAAPDACQAFIGQPDAVVVAKRKNPSIAIKQIASLHREYLQVLCSKKSGITDLEQVAGSDKYSVNIGPEGSGGWAVWQNFIANDKSYADVPTRSDPDNLALGSVAADETSCMLVPAGLNNGTVVEADQYDADSVSLVEATDWDFNDAKDIKGEPLYTFMKIPRTYKNLQGWIGGSVETVSWNAGFYVNPTRIDPAALGELLKFTNRARADVLNTFGK